MTTMKIEMIFKNKSVNYLTGKTGPDLSSIIDKVIIYSLQREHIIK